MAALAQGALRRIDALILAYLGLSGLVAAFRIPVRPRAAWVLLVNLLIAALVLLLQDQRIGRAGRTLREVYPILLLPVLYASLDLVNGFDVRTWDPLVRGWEEALFGGQISRTWWRARPSVLWSTVLHAAYFAFYLIIPLPVLHFLWRGPPEQVRVTVTLVTATFLFCYLCFLLFPVAGPYYEFPRPTGAFIENWAARLVYGTLDRGSSYGAAFPSSHVAATVAATIAAWRGSRGLGMALAVPTALLTVGVVYCQMHYAVDALAGVLLPLVLMPVVFKRALMTTPEPESSATSGAPSAPRS